MYYSIKCSYGVNEFFYKRGFKKHNHDAQKQFVIDAKNQAILDLAAAGVAGITSNLLSTTAIRQEDNDPGDDYREI